MEQAGQRFRGVGRRSRRTLIAPLKLHIPDLTPGIVGFVGLSPILVFLRQNKFSLLLRKVIYAGASLTSPPYTYVRLFQNIRTILLM